MRWLTESDGLRDAWLQLARRETSDLPQPNTFANIVNQTLYSVIHS